MRFLRGKAVASAVLLPGVLFGGVAACGDGGGGGDGAAPEAETVKLAVGKTGEFDTGAGARGVPGTTFRVTVRRAAYLTEVVEPVLGGRTKPKEKFFALVELRIENIGDAPGTLQPHQFPWMSDSGRYLHFVGSCCLPGQKFSRLNLTYPPRQWAQGTAVYDVPEKGGHLFYPAAPRSNDGTRTPLLSIELPDA
ncbi:DUF4352 domain-containing protein [Streptomyces sp. HC44]|uniref:DUF4352 domain-containing protein n=1 Tax=Streptomyces scabichelini TaxID=2711217 RepID=A0A6G4VHB7_9ACTN|nr:DUF4352 domain-containing protein [Streptomyces scabichelini]NGO13275.1 DUF4352 domain-containing protein [Streptomyces scabichelini]